MVSLPDASAHVFHQSQTGENVSNQKFILYQVRKKLDVPGQGVVGFRFKARERFRILFRSGCSSIMVDVGVNQSSFRIITKGQPDRIIYQVSRDTAESNPFVDVGRMQTYWFSIDKNNNWLRFGKGEMRHELCEMQYQFTALRHHDGMAWFDQLDRFAIAGSFNHAQISAIQPLYQRMPVTTSPPPVIVPGNQLDLETIDTNRATVIHNLSEECAQLYHNIAGRNLCLNTPDFMDFSDAINYSIVTEGALCHTRLKAKTAHLPDKLKKQSYLRITVGENRGDSPGAPYVLEIWPGQHYSPVHRHAQCHAIIKVLHGSLSCRWFRSLQHEEQQPYLQSVLAAGQVTWIEPEQFQTHQLYNHNVAGNMCATIQCYQYSKEDHAHYEYFDYLGHGNHAIQHFTPTADWRYSEFKALIKAEWERYKAQCIHGPGGTSDPPHSQHTGNRITMPSALTSRAHNHRSSIL